MKKLPNLLFSLAIIALAFWHWGLYFAITIFVISFLIFFHEFGHFIVAKALKVNVITFSIGFGEKILTYNFKGTQYALSAIPLGGYVQLKGQNDANPKEKNYDADSYNSLSPIKRIAILFAGPFFNLLLAFLLYIWVGFLGVDKLAPVVGKLLPNSAALGSGLMVNDRILKIDGVEIKEWDEIRKQVNLDPINLLILRDNKTLNITLTPKISKSKNIFGEDVQIPLIGISPDFEQLVKIKHTGFESLSYAYTETINASKLIYKGLYKLISGVVPIKDMAGIVAMSDITTKVAQIGLVPLLLMTALISVNLGLLNLLPLPVLDGGHIAFNLYEILFKKEVNERVFVALSYCSMVLLLALMAFTVVNDLYRMFGVN